MGKKKKEAPKPKRELTRKEVRKEKRLMKKKGRSTFFELKRGKRKGNEVSKNNFVIPLSPKGLKKADDVSDKTIQKQKLVVSKQPPNANLNRKKAQDKLFDQMKKQRKRQLLDANKMEDKEIKFLEKRLRIDNKKSVSNSKGFADCGLDYLLDVCDSEKMSSAINSETNFEGSDSDFSEDFAMVQNDGHETSSKKHKTPKADVFTSEKDEKRHVQVDSESEVPDGSDTHSENGNFSDEDNLLNSSGEDESGAESSGQEEETGAESSGEEIDDNAEISEIKRGDTKPKVWEDIYGRLRDQKGNILKHNDGKYIPPHLRNLEDSDEIKKQRELIRQLKGLLNRLALNNMHRIANQIEDIYSKNSRNSVNEALLNLLYDSLVSPVLSPERLIIDHAMLVAVLHANVGSEIGAYMLQSLIQKFCSLLPCQTIEDKGLDNLLFLISYLYNFKLFESVLMYDILLKLCSQLTEKNIDLILIVLRSVGFPLRKDDPMAMKGFLLNVQKQMNTISNVEDQSRMKYLLEVLLSIKNNNVSKLSDFDPEQHEHLKKVLKSVIRSGNSIVALRIGLEDLLKAEERGRWWLVGSAWNKEDDKPQKAVKDTVPREEFSSQILALAKEQRMNTDYRRNIFCILMSAEDYQDAFEKLLKLGLKGQQEREIPLVIIHCLLQEKHYNPYYMHIADQLCASDRRHQMTLQCALWDRFRTLEKLSSSQISCLAKFLAEIVLAGSIPISVLKVIEFTELDKRYTRLLRQTILSIAKVEAKESMCQVFMRVSKSKKLSLFKEALRLFVHHFILRNMPDSELKGRVSLINSILTGDVD